MPFSKTSYFHSANIGTIPRLITGKNWIFGIIHCITYASGYKKTGDLELGKSVSFYEMGCISIKFH